MSGEAASGEAREVLDLDAGEPSPRILTEKACTRPSPQTWAARIVIGNRCARAVVVTRNF